MSELKPCPFCGSEAENINLLGHKGYKAGEWKQRIAVCCKNKECSAHLGDFYEKRDAVEAWNRRAEDDNPPLTLEELRQMDGEPVYIVSGTEGGYWELSVDAEDYFMDRHEEFYGMTCSVIGCQGCSKNNGLHHLGWLAYRYKTFQSTPPFGGVTKGESKKFTRRRNKK